MYRRSAVNLLRRSTLRPDCLTTVLNATSQPTILRNAAKTLPGNLVHSKMEFCVKCRPKIHDDIAKIIANNRVVVFMKGTPDAPMCGFSRGACNILQTEGVQFHGENVLVSDELRQGIKTYSDWPTIPQIYIDGEFVGGADILTQMYRSGELREKLENNGIIPKHPK